MASVDLLLHPVRLRILQAFLGDRTLTTSDLSAELSDIPAASLYRHVALLADAGVLEAVAERRVRGAVERTYELRLPAATVGPDQFASMTVDEHRQAFMAFVAGLLGDFERYLARDDIDLRRDGVTYSIAALWLDDAEHAQMMSEIVEVLQPRYANQPRPGRRRRLLGSVLLPAEDAARYDAGDAARNDAGDAAVHGADNHIEEAASR
ncbi:MAG TPA: helix-turn-helix domain-containing protein [Micromonosporaceae bacterium]